MNELREKIKQELKKTGEQYSHPYNAYQEENDGRINYRTNAIIDAVIAALPEDPGQYAGDDYRDGLSVMRNDIVNILQAAKENK